MRILQESLAPSLLEGAPLGDFRLLFGSQLHENAPMDAFKLIPVSLAGWMNRRQQHVIAYPQEEIIVLKEHQADRRIRFTDEQRARLKRGRAPPQRMPQDRHQPTGGSGRDRGFLPSGVNLDRDTCTDKLIKAGKIRVERETIVSRMGPHFIVDQHPVHGRVNIAFGLSGHDFKLASFSGVVPPKLALDGAEELPIKSPGPRPYG
jgi:hypothetical protein